MTKKTNKNNKVKMTKKVVKATAKTAMKPKAKTAVKPKKPVAKPVAKTKAAPKAKAKVVAAPKKKVVSVKASKPAIKKPAAKAPVKAAPKAVAKAVKAPIKAAPKAAVKQTAKQAAEAAAPARTMVSMATAHRQLQHLAPNMAAQRPAQRPVQAPAMTTPRIVAAAKPGTMQQPVTRTIPAGMRPMNAHPVAGSVAGRSMAGRPGAPVVARPANDTPVDFRTGDYVVYPAHGVGTIEGVETQSIAGMSVTLYAIAFEKDRMRLKIPVQKAQIAGLRKLSSGDRLKDALKTLTGKAKIKRTMWSRRAQEYEAKINSGDPVQIAEVLRDLRRPKDDTEQSYSERQIYQSALERLAREVAAVQRIAEAKAVEHLETVLAQAA